MSYHKRHRVQIETIQPQPDWSSLFSWIPRWGLFLLGVIFGGSFVTLIWR